MRRPSPAVLGVALVGLGAVASCLLTYAVHGYRFPIGADAPVYIWWARLAAHDGLSSVGGRPGGPALTLVLSGLTGAGTGVIVTALEVVLVAAIGTSVVVLLTLGETADRVLPRGARWCAAIACVGFASHLAVGYVATLTLAACFLGALALLMRGSRAATVGAGALLAAGVLAHPTLAPLAFAVLGITATMAWRRRDRSAPWADTEHGRIILAGAGAVMLSGAALAALLRGPGPLQVDTSRDDFLARSGLGATLAPLFRSRLAEHASRYAPVLSIPLAVVGGRRAAGPLGRALRAWALVVVLGVVGGYVTGAFPPERVVSFGFVIPIAAGIGVAAVAARVRVRLTGYDRRGLARIAPLLAPALLAAMVLPALHLWFSTPPELFPLEVARVREAVAAIRAPAGTPLVVIVSGRQPVASFFATEAGNAVRASVPPGRIRDVRIVVPGGPERVPTPENARLVAQTRRDAGQGGDPVVVLDLAPFDRTGFGVRRTSAALPASLPTPTPVGTGIAVAQPAGRTSAPLSTPDPGPGDGSFPRMVLTSIAVVAAFLVAGIGWARRCVGRDHPVEALALAPIVGAAGLILAGVALDLGGLRLGTAGTAWAAWIVVAGAGLVTERRAAVTRVSEPAVGLSPTPVASSVRPRA